MLAIPYARWSSAGQTTGTSLARQAADPEAYCRARGWRLWDGAGYSDPGVSAFAGDHLADGALGRFLADHRAGRFGGEPVALLLEDVDRFSRSFPLAILPVLVDDVLNAGITLSLTAFDRDYSRGSIRANPLELHELLMRLSAAHEFSERLSRRMSFVHRQRREHIRAGRPVAAGLAPSWIEHTPNGWAFTPYADIVRQILQLSRTTGATVLARQLTADGVPTPADVLAERRGRPRPQRAQWGHSTVVDLISSPMIHGARRVRQPGHQAALRAWKEAVAQLRRQGVAPEQWPPRPQLQWVAPQDAYYPAILTPSEHADLLAAVAARRPVAAGRTDRQRWIAAGLTACVCGERMGATSSSRTHAEGPRCYAYLRCRAVGRGGTCNSPMVAVGLAQAHLLTRLTGDQFAAMLEGAAGGDRAQLLAAAVAQQQTAERQVIQLEQQHAAGEAALAAEMDAAVVAVLARRAATLDAALADARRALADARGEVARLQAGPSLTALGGAARAQISAVLQRFAGGTDTVEDRRMVAGHLRALGIRIVIDAAGGRLALAIGDGPPEWQPIDPDLALYALEQAATDATFTADEEGTIVTWPSSG